MRVRVCVCEMADEQFAVGVDSDSGDEVAGHGAFVRFLV